MEAIVNSATLNSTILHKKNFTYSFSLNLMMAAILNSAILDLAILHKKNFSPFIVTQPNDGSHLEFYLPGFSHFAQKRFTHSFWFNLMMAAHLELCHLGFQTPCYLLSDSLKNNPHSILTLTQTNSIWQKLIHSHLTLWWQPSWILPCSNPPSWIQAS